MIRIESIRIEEFRGIRDLTLDLKGMNFAVCGPNGTGKSGVVDALEFALTGNVSRLSGEGRGDISLRDHAPHVDSRDFPEKARVTVTVLLPGRDKPVTIERTVKKPKAPRITPNEPAVVELLESVALHPEIVLSRRELIKYVLATPGDRAKEVQALLHLDQVERVRTGLQKVANACEREHNTLVAATARAREPFLRALAIPEMDRAAVLTAANARRAVLGLAPIPELTDTTSLKDGMGTPVRATPQRIPKAQAMEDIRAVRETLAALSGAELAGRIAEVRADLEALAADPTLANATAEETFLSAGIELIDHDACPFCDHTWEQAALIAHVKSKLKRLEDVSQRRSAATTKLEPIGTLVGDAKAGIDGLVQWGVSAEPRLEMESAREFSRSCADTVKQLGAFLPLADTIAALETVPAVPKAVHGAIGALEKAVLALPEPTEQDAAREWLTVAQERLEGYRVARRAEEKAKAQAQRARTVSDTYAMTSDRVLAGIYTTVQDQFASFYSFVNRDDEGGFKAVLKPSMGKLGFDVDFYGKGYFPPGAYHSEGHQDGMGLCLYLALMRYLQGDRFSIAVLDDVLMSVDAGHRRQVVALLKDQFPDTQFVITTHDPMWLRHMKTEGLIAGGSAVHFRSWDVSQGPTHWKDRDVWAEIHAHLEQNDVRSAAGLLRHYLEHVSQDLCDRLRVPVEFRGDGQHQLGDMFVPLISHVRTLLRKAKDAASSWNDQGRVEEYAALESSWTTRATATRAEEWQVNTAIHFNAWENLVKADFAPVAKAFQELLGLLSCGKCGVYLRVVPSRETPKTLGCGCGDISINLERKK